MTKTKKSFIAYKPALLDPTLKYTISDNILTIDLKDNVENHFKSLNIEEPKIIFTTEAFQKMNTLVKLSDKEIAWHGIVERHGMQFTITDILIYPQTVTASTVEADTEKYINWNIQLTNDQVNHMRLQGHSHVNMGVIPSGTDLNYYKELLNQVNDYYIFIIMNKQKQYHTELYIKGHNLLYEDVQVTTELLDDIEPWAYEEMKKHIIEDTPAYQTNNNYYYDPQIITPQENIATSRKVISKKDYIQLLKPINKTPSKNNFYWDHSDNKIKMDVVTNYNFIGSKETLKDYVDGQILVLSVPYYIIQIEHGEKLAIQFEVMSVLTEYAPDLVFALTGGYKEKMTMEDYQDLVIMLTYQGYIDFNVKTKKFVFADDKKTKIPDNTVRFTVLEDTHELK